MILVTGASGNLGKAVVSNLLNLIPAQQIAVLARDENKVAQLSAKGVKVVLGDYHNPSSLEKAFEGVSKLLLVSSSDFNGRLQQHKNAIDAAKKAGVKHILYTGVTIKDVQQSPLKAFLEDHFLTEDYIKTTGIAYTFLRNNLYLDVIPMFAGEKAVNTGVFFASGDGKVAFASRTDLAEATAKILTTEGHENKVYHLSNTQSYSFANIATVLSELAEKEVAFTSPEPEAFATALQQFGLPEHIIGMSLGFAAGIKHNDFDLPSNELKNLLGREPKSLKTFLQEVYFN